MVSGQKYCAGSTYCSQGSENSRNKTTFFSAFSLQPLFLSGREGSKGAGATVETKATPVSPSCPKVPVHKFKKGS